MKDIFRFLSVMCLVGAIGSDLKHDSSGANLLALISILCFLVVFDLKKKDLC